METILITQDNWNDLLEQLTTTSGTITYFDTETTGFDPHTEKLVMITLQQEISGMLTDVFVVDCRGYFGTDQKSFLRALFTNTFIIGHNLAFDLGWMNYLLGVWPQNGVWDTMLAEQVIRGKGLSSAKSEGISFGLKQLAKEYVGVEMDKDTRDYFIGLDKEPDWYIPFPDDAVTYAALDVSVLPDIYWKQRSDHIDIDYDKERCIELENRAVLAYAHMKLSGLPVNVGEWEDVIEEKRKEAEELKAKALAIILPVIQDHRSVEFDKQNVPYLEWEKELLDFRSTLTPGNIKEPLAAWKKEHPKPYKPKLDTEFNLGSPTQLMELFEVMGIKAKNTSKEVLKVLADEHPVCKALVEWREAEKFVTSFGDAVLNNVNPVTHRIHPDWQQIGTDTDRTSCQRPNLQQIPARTTTGKKLRHAVQSEGVFLDADFASQELCILAELSGETEMLDAFERGEDLHHRTACLMFNQPADTNSRTYQFQGLSIRDIAKTINYGIAYGMTKYRLAKLLHIGYDEAQELIDRWYDTFPDAMKWLEARKQQVDRGQWYSKTLHGWVRRYRPLSPEPHKPHYGVLASSTYREWKERLREWELERNGLMNQMMNSPIQGTGAGITKLALTLFFERAILNSDNGYSIKPKIVAVIHDEILVECHGDEADYYAELLADCMNEAEGTYLKRVKFPKAEVNISKHWEH